MSSRKAKISLQEQKVLKVLLDFYRDHGPGATPNVKGLEEEAGIHRHELEVAIRSLHGKGLIEYWELAPAIRLTAEGLEFITGVEGKGESTD